MENPASPPPPPANKKSFRDNLPLVLALSMAGIGLVAVCIFAVLIACSRTGACGSLLAGGDDGGATPTPFAIGTLAAPPDSVLSIQLDSGETISLTVDTPNLLTIDAQNFAVQRGAPDAAGRWAPTVGSATTAVWLNGTVINYVFALQDTAEIRTLMESLERGDMIVLTTKAGETRRFDFSSREIVPVTQQDVFAQNTPAVTLLLVGLGDRSTDRMVVRARFVSDEAAQNITPGGTASETNVVALGEVAQLGDLQIAVTTLDNRPITGSSFAYFLVDYQIQNNGALPFDTTLLELSLVDNVGNIYNLSLDASRLGNNPPLSPTLGSGQMAQATAGYQTPSGLGAESLTWIVRRTDTGEQIEVRSATTTDADGAPLIGITVELLNAELTPDAASLLLSGQVRNESDSVLVVEQTDVQMISDGTVFFILSTNPSFPWVVGPGQTIPYALTVQRPQSAEQAVFSILDQSFELSNYR